MNISIPFVVNIISKHGDHGEYRLFVDNTLITERSYNVGNNFCITEYFNLALPDGEHKLYIENINTIDPNFSKDLSNKFVFHSVKIYDCNIPEFKGKDLSIFYI
jgi:hypothetical protein